jgi:hypothetical protein
VSSHKTTSIIIAFFCLQRLPTTIYGRRTSKGKLRWWTFNLVISELRQSWKIEQFTAHRSASNEFFGQVNHAELSLPPQYELPLTKPRWRLLATMMSVNRGKLKISEHYRCSIVKLVCSDYNCGYFGENKIWLKRQTNKMLRKKSFQWKQKANKYSIWESIDLFIIPMKATI